MGRPHCRVGSRGTEDFRIHQANPLALLRCTRETLGMLQINDLTYRLGERLLLDHATVSIPTGARVGVVGRNGTGKTTLFKIVCCELPTEGGSFSLPKQVRIGRVEQEAPGSATTLTDFVLAADTERDALLAEAETATDPTRIADIQTRLTDIGAHSAPARAAAILHGLGFDAEAQARPCSDFSGGWRMRVALAAVLFSEPDLLLLDEPTNYLDLEGALWLQNYLARYPHTMVLISHDRDFLDIVTNHILHLSRGKLTIYRGGYTSFDRQRREKAMLLAKAADKQADERKRLQAFVDRFKAKASKARQAQSRMKRLEKMEPIIIEGAEEDATIHLPSPEKPLAPPLIAMESVSVGYGERTVLSRISVTIADDDRIGLLGANGNGKSTLVKLISGRLEKKTGALRASQKLKIAYFAQHQLDELDANATPVTMVRQKMAGATEAQVRSRTAQLGFGALKADTTITRLSGGERARLLLGLAAFDGPHLLILDEPTNHLDIEARAALVEALSDYTGAVIIVSHDRFLLEASCDRLWLVSGGTVRPFDGDLDDYTKLILSGTDAPPRDEKPAFTPKPQEAPKKPSQSRGKLEKKISELDLQIAKLNDLIRRVDATLADPNTFRKDAAFAAKLTADRGTLAKRLEVLEEEWLSIQEELENA